MSKRLWLALGGLAAAALAVAGVLWTMSPSQPPPASPPSAAAPSPSTLAPPPSTAEPSAAARPPESQPVPSQAARAREARDEMQRDQEEAMSRFDALPFAELLPLPDDILQWAVLRRIWAKEAAVPHERLPRPEQNVCLIASFLGHVGQGGFAQLFLSTDGDRALEIREALREVGAGSVLPLYQRALDLFPGSRPAPVLADRARQMQAFGETQRSLLKKLDDEFYKAQDGVDAEIAGYIRSLRDRFDLPPLPPKEQRAGRDATP